MGWRDKARLWAARELVKATRWAIFPNWMRHSFMDITFSTLVREGYKKNSAVFSCVQALAFGFSEPRLQVYTAGAPDGLHPAAQLLHHPNPDMGLKSLLQATMTYTAIGGNCYWLKVYNRRGAVVELWPLHDGQMTPIPGGARLISHYELLDGDGVKLDEIPREQVIHFKWAVDPLQLWRGLSPLVTVAREADLDSEMTDYTFALLKNNAVPPLALIAPENVILQDYQIRRMKQEWMEQYGGENRGKPAILEGGVDVKQLSFDINRMAAEAMRNIPESRICAAFKVPPTVALLYVGLQHMTYDNVQGMLRYFTEQTLIPMWDRFDDTITHGLSQDFDLAESEVQFDTRNVVALQRKRLELGEFVDRAVRGGYMTRNEARTELSLPETRDGDVFLVGFSTVAEPALHAGKALASSEAKSLKAKTPEARRQAALMVGRTLQSIRKSAEVRMAADLERFFYELATRVMERALALTEAGVRASVLEWKLAEWEPGQHDPTTACGLAALTAKAEQLTLPGLFDDADFADLLHVFGFWAYTILEESWETWNYALDTTLSFNRNDPAVVALVQTLGDRITLIGEATRNGVRELLSEGYQRGWSIDHIVRGDPDAGIPGLRDTVSGLTYRNPQGRLVHISAQQRARMIARTELGTAQNRTTYSRYANAGVERVLVLDDGFDNSHEFCRAINGKVVPMSWAQGHALCHPNCLVGNTRVKMLAGDELLAGYAREFHGEVVVLRTALNQEITCTPNHPVLTRQGWVAAGKLREGDQVISGGWGEREVGAFENPDDDQVEFTIENVVRAFLEAPGVTTTSVPGSAVDFHGDGVPGQVNIVFADGLLEGDALHAAFGEHGGELLFVDAGEGAALALAGLRALEQFGVGSGNASDSGMSSGGVEGALLGGPECVEFTFSEDAQASPSKVSAQGTITDADLGGQLADADTSEMPGVQSGIVSGGGDESVLALVEGVTQLAARNSALVGQLIEALSGLVTAVEIVKIERKAFSGHVYNLSTRSNCYMANGIITHNCVRAFAPEFDAPVDEGAIAAAEAAGTCPFG